MSVAEVMALLEANRNERGIENWELLEKRPDKLKSFGIGLTVLRKLAKKIGRNRELALELWKSDFYDARVIALLIDDPKQVTRKQAEEQVENLAHGFLSHVFSSCDATLAKTGFVVDLARDWIESDDVMRRRCGYGLLYEISKSKKKSAPDNAFFLDYVKHIGNAFSNEERSVHHAMGVALMGIGCRNRELHGPALDAARKIGPIPVETGKTKCPPFDVAKNLTSDFIRNKLGV